MFVRENNAFVPAMQADAGDQAGADFRSGPVGSSEFLFQVIQGRLDGLAEDSIGAPSPVQVAGASVFVALLGVAGFFLSELDPNQIVGGALEVLLAHFRGDFVIRLRQHSAGVNALSIVEDAVKGLDISHGWAE